MDERDFRIAVYVIGAVVLLSALDALVEEFSAGAAFGVLGIVAGAIGAGRVFRGRNGNGGSQ